MAGNRLIATIMSEQIKQALAIIDRREKLSDKGKAEMRYSEYMEIKRLLSIEPEQEGNDKSSN